VAVSAEEFANIPSTTKGRAKLEEINQIYRGLLESYRNRPQSSYSVQEMTDMGLKVAGATGASKLLCLKYLGIIEIQKNGSVALL